MRTQDNNNDKVEFLVTRRRKDVCADGAMGVADVQNHLDLCVQQLQLLMGMADGDSWKDMMYKTCGDMVGMLVGSIDCFIDSQKAMPRFVMEANLDVKGYLDWVDRMMEGLKMGDDAHFLGTELEDEVYSEGALWRKLGKMKGCLMELYRMMNVGDDGLLKGVYDLVKGRMQEGFRLREVVEMEIDVRCGLERGGKLMPDKVHELQGALFAVGDDGVNWEELRLVLGNAYESGAKREVEIGRFIFMQHRGFRGNGVEWNRRLRAIMERVYGYEYYQRMDGRREAMVMTDGALKELDVAYEIVNVLPIKHRGKGVDEHTIETIWREVLSDMTIRKWLLKRGSDNYKGFGLRSLGLLLGRCLYHRVYVDMTPTEMAGYVGGVCRGKEKLLRNYICQGQNMGGGMPEGLELVDDAIRRAVR